MAALEGAAQLPNGGVKEVQPSRQLDPRVFSGEQESHTQSTLQTG